MRAIDSDLVGEKNKLHQPSPWIWLLEVSVSDTESARIANYQQNVTWNGDTYYSFPFSIGEIQQSAEGQLPTLNISVANVSREVQEILDANDGLARQKVWLRLVHADHLANADAVLEDRFTILQATANVNAVTFQLGRVDLFDLEVPRRRYSRDYCQHVYKGTVCGYQGDLPSCDHTLDGANGCERHGVDEFNRGLEKKHPRRFGGAPAIPRARR